MGLGNTAKKIQMLADRAEQLYAQLTEVREEMTDLRQKVDRTHRTVETLETRTEEQQALLEAIAEREGIDVDTVLTEAAIDEAEEAPEAETEPGTEPDPTGSEPADSGVASEDDASDAV